MLVVWVLLCLCCLSFGFLLVVFVFSVGLCFVCCLFCLLLVLGCGVMWWLGFRVWVSCLCVLFLVDL